MTEFRTAYGPRKRVSIKFKKRGRTKQEFKKQCDINEIVKRYQRTGALDHFAKHGGRYMDVTPTSFHEAMNIVVEAEQMFADLPSSLRARFENDPAEFLEFVQNPENQDEMRDLGLMEGPVAPVPLPDDSGPPEGVEPSLEGVSEATTGSEEN